LSLEHLLSFTTAAIFDAGAVAAAAAAAAAAASNLKCKVSVK
jgi:hypothetical protein